MIDYCFGCNKKRIVKEVGVYIYKNKTYSILICQWCKAVNTKRKKIQQVTPVEPPA